MLKKILTAALLMTTAAPVFAGSQANVTGYALAENGAKLVVMADVSTPEAMTGLTLANPVQAIAWRPVTGDLLGFAKGAIYTIDTKTGSMTDLSADFMKDAQIDDDAAVAFDFNNKIDAVRAVSSKGDNLVYFPAGFGDNDDRANSVRRFTSLAYAESDAMAGQTPAIFANAYTNAIRGAKAGGTFQYALDANSNVLVSLANNAGTLATIGKITVDGKVADLAPVGGFDIVSEAEGKNKAFAVLKMVGASTSGLYTIDLETGAAVMLADLGTRNITGFAAAIGG